METGTVRPAARIGRCTPSPAVRWLLLGLLLALLLAACGAGDEPTAAPAPATPAAATLAVVGRQATAPPSPEPLDDTRPITVSLGLSIGAAAETGPILVPTPTPTNPFGIVTAPLVNVRRAPQLDADVVRTAEAGARLEIDARSSDGQWLRLCCPDAGTEWVAAEFVRVDDAAPLAAESTPAAPGTTALVNADLINLRGGPGLAYPVVGQARRGDPLAVIGQNEAGDWWQLCCADDADADTSSWVSAELAPLAAPQAAALPVAQAPPPPAPAPVPAQAAQGAVLAAAPASGLPGDGGFGPSGGINPLTGLPLGGGNGRPLIVCINNDYAARPQYGISQADVMYEYVMEGFGITRFSGVFYGDTVSQIGPVRSARLINYYLGALYNGGLACSGASDRVRYALKHEAPFPYMDIDLDDASNTRYSVSIGRDYRTRLRTATDKLRRWLADWGVEEQVRVRGFTFGDAGAGGAPATSIAIPYPSATGSQAAYTYDAGSGRYLRAMGGAPHLDGNSGAQVGVENVIVQVVPHEITDIVEDSLGSKSIRLNLFGSGRAIVFRDGQAHEGTWRSDSRGDLPRFYRADGTEIPLKPGRTWISVVPRDYAVSFR